MGDVPMSEHSVESGDTPVVGCDPTNRQCGAAYPCRDDHDEPCFCGLIGPRKRLAEVRYSQRFV
jgi:hypothetical protein